MKATLTAHRLHYWSEAQKFIYLIQSVKTDLGDTCLANTSGSVVLRYDFYAAARHVADFLVIMNSRDPGSNRNISGVDTDQCGGRVRGYGGGPGRGGRGGVGGRSCG